MMRKAVFIELTKPGDSYLYLNAFWIGHMIDQEDGTTAIYLSMDGDNPIIVKENSSQIINKIKRELNKYDISLD